jgi:hypothetical protein
MSACQPLTFSKLHNIISQKIELFIADNEIDILDGLIFLNFFFFPKHNISESGSLSVIMYEGRQAPTQVT